MYCLEMGKSSLFLIVTSQSMYILLNFILKRQTGRVGGAVTFLWAVQSSQLLPGFILFWRMSRSLPNKSELIQTPKEDESIGEASANDRFLIIL